MNLDSAVFYSNDLKAITQFYRDSLGFKIEYEQAGKFVSFIFPNGARLGIKQKSEEREIPGAQTCFVSLEEGIETLYHRLQSLNLVFYRELTVADWATYFAILDLDGNKIEFITRPS
jgi:catechol 2,3-dioxygenase-like lactoylglutathione lyase family enzyme